MDFSDDLVLGWWKFSTPGGRVPTAAEMVEAEVIFEEDLEDYDYDLGGLIAEDDTESYGSLEDARAQARHWVSEHVGMLEEGGEEVDEETKESVRAHFFQGLE